MPPCPSVLGGVRGLGNRYHGNSIAGKTDHRQTTNPTQAPVQIPFQSSLNISLPARTLNPETTPSYRLSLGIPVLGSVSSLSHLQGKKRPKSRKLLALACTPAVLCVAYGVPSDEHRSKRVSALPTLRRDLRRKDKRQRKGKRGTPTTDHPPQPITAFGQFPR
ncbi:hypothetical protein LZ30DRAFT_288117 [Colletotrichum cereale]|nr:hypothetical protein LZ30DRAFT_288117 [Colletotrichum cereale]